MNVHFDPTCCIPPPPDFNLAPPPDPSAWLPLPPSPLLDCPSLPHLTATINGQGPLLSSSSNHNHAVFPPGPSFPESGTTGGGDHQSQGNVWLHPTFSLVLAAVVIFCVTACTAVTAILYCKKRRLKPSSPHPPHTTPPASSFPSYGCTPVGSGSGHSCSTHGGTITGKESSSHWVFNSSLVFTNPDKGGNCLPHTQSVLEVSAKHPHFKLHHAPPLHSASFTGGGHCYGSHPFLPHGLRCPTNGLLGPRGSIPCGHAVARGGQCPGGSRLPIGHFCPTESHAQQEGNDDDYQTMRCCTTDPSAATINNGGPIYEEIQSLDRTLDDHNATYTLRSTPHDNKNSKIYCCDDSSCSDISFLPDEPHVTPPPSQCCHIGGQGPTPQGGFSLGLHPPLSGRSMGSNGHSPSCCDTSGGRESGYGTQCGGQGGGNNPPSADGSYDSPPLLPPMSLAQMHHQNGLGGGLYHHAVTTNNTAVGPTTRLRNGPSAIKTNPMVAYNRNSRTFTPTGDFV